MPEDRLLELVRQYVRAGSADDALLVPLISAAKQYLLNAGVPEPIVEEPEPPEEPTPASGELSLYELAVTLYVNTIYNGGNEKVLEQAMTGIILQIKTYGGEAA